MIRSRERALLSITNPKVASLAPTWRRYHGISVLFDNPGTRAPAGVARLEDIPIVDPPRQRVFDDLSRAVVTLDETWRERHGLCPLPRHSYHITVCDGPNQTSGVRSVTTLLDGLPSSLDRLTDRLSVMTGSRLLHAVAENPVTLVVAEIVVRGHVLAAALAPAGTADRAALARIADARNELVDDLWRLLRLRTQPWRPHVSLAYFPNRAAARAADAALPTVYRDLPAALATSSITMSSAAVYGFTDMATFFRSDDGVAGDSQRLGTGK